MRCPKCGYISFDHLEKCLKCKKDISAVSDTLQGGVLHVASPVFLNLQSQEDQSDESDLVAEGEGVEVEDAVADFDIIVEEDSAEGREEEVTLEVDQNEEESFIDFEISSDEEEESEIAIDSALFDDDTEIEEQLLDNQLDSLSEEDTDDFEIDMPEELLDMSDLAAPALSEDIKSPDLDSQDELNSLDIDLNSFDFDLDSDLSAGDGPLESSGGEEDEISLSDIDFSDTISGPTKEGRKQSGAMDMDEDFDFDLDLDGLSIRDDE
jgi:uncharacterized OB-fold protein